MHMPTASTIFFIRIPEIKPALLTHFEPWYPMLWTDGSIGAITTAGLHASDLQQVYGKSTGKQLSAVPVKPDLYTGSNGFAIAPSNTKDKSAILYINPHVTFYFRPEVHMVSEEGLNVYGAVTWGQFFIYQGFNEHCGWMHTSSQVDVSDSYIEKLSLENGNWQYSYQGENKPVTIKPQIFRYKSGDTLATVTIPAMFTHHGPIMGKLQDNWLSVRSFNRSSISLQQSWLRTKATSFAEFRKSWISVETHPIIRCMPMRKEISLTGMGTLCPGATLHIIGISRWMVPLPQQNGKGCMLSMKLFNP
jgi:acyl-homoserine lactone acylase PvdQ